MKLEWYEYTVRAGGRRPSSVGNFRAFSGKMLGIGPKTIQKKGYKPTNINITPCFNNGKRPKLMR